MKLALQKSPIPATQAFVVRYLKEPHFDPNWHFHPEYQLFVVLRGTGTRFIGDQVKPFKEGDLVFTGPNLPHLWRSDPEYFEGKEENWTEGIVIYFQEDFLGKSFLQKEEMHRLKQLFLMARRGFEVTGSTAVKVKKMMKELLEQEGFARVIQLLQILNVLATTPGYHILSSLGYTNTLKEADTERMNKVHAFVMKNFRNRISLEEVATIANMAPTSFSRYFKTHANKTFSDFVSEIRIGYACKLLMEDHITISQACYESGFQTLSNFNRLFKAFTSRTPRAYKKEFSEAVIL
ncbi:AraC family transcriptional regulator [Flammeovirgaceae bacterium 311]|nr:AraC family transcriptional regulator [Flammeovirgaceae bacterium 311]